MQERLPATETARIAELRGYGILDTPAERDYDRLARSIALVFGVPSAVISFIDTDRQWYKAKVGVEADWVPRAISFCTHSIGSDDVTVALDAREDARFRDNPYVTAPGGIRFYAAAPIRSARRARIGTVCVFDTVPRAAVTAYERDMLVQSAAKVTALLERRRLTS